MSISTSDFTLNPQLVSVILDKMQINSGFQAASKLVPLTPSGVIIGNLGTTEADWVDEGGKKPAKKASVGEVTIVGKKLAKVVAWTDEAGVAVPNLETLLETEALPALALAFDKTVAGEKNAPTGFDSLTGATKVNINDRVSFIKAVAPKANRIGKSSLVINEVMFSELLALTTSNGVGVLNIMPENDFTGTINGIRYFIYASDLATAKGFVGPFADKSYWGVLPNSVLVKPVLGSYEDENGDTIHLDQRNMKAFIVEGRFGFKLADKTLFKEITVEAPAEGGA